MRDYIPLLLVSIFAPNALASRLRWQTTEELRALATQDVLEDIKTSSQSLRYAVFGDSWASGVNYGPPSDDLEYDYPDGEEICRCRRVNEAYAVQLVKDPDRSWLGGHNLTLDFVACHGAEFDQIPKQVEQLDPNLAPDFATLMIGGNPGGFPNIMEDCVFQYDRHRNYGPQYPDSDGECARTLALAHETVKSRRYYNEFSNSIRTILREPRTEQNPNFRLYVLSYSALFNDKDHACDNFTFGVWPGKKPLLTTELRREVNAVLDDAREVYDRLINRVLRDPRVVYINTDEILAGHRFCEPTEGGTFQSQNDNSWLYPPSYPSCIPLLDHEMEGPNDNFLDDDKTNWPRFCRSCHGPSGIGELRRPFHPRPAGHEAMKNFLKQYWKDNPIPMKGDSASKPGLINDHAPNPSLEL